MNRSALFTQFFLPISIISGNLLQVQTYFSVLSNIFPVRFSIFSFLHPLSVHNRFPLHGRVLNPSEFRHIGCPCPYFHPQRWHEPPPKREWYFNCNLYIRLHVPACVSRRERCVCDFHRKPRKTVLISTALLCLHLDMITSLPTGSEQLIQSMVR